MPPSPPPARAVLWRDRILVFAAALALYTLLRQGSTYRDGCYFLFLVHKGVFDQNVHYLYLPLLRLLHFLLRPFDATWFQAGAVYSALGTAVGVAFVHAACCVLGLPRGRALLVTAFVASCAPALFFATLVEKHGPGFAFDGLACWLAARLIVAPSAARAAWLGASMGTAFLVHSFGALLPAALLTVFLAERHRSGRLRSRADALAALRLCVVAVAVEAVLVFGAPAVFRALGFATATSGITSYLLVRMAGIESVPEAVAFLFWHEWLLPFGPASVLFLLGLARPATRPLTLALIAGLLGYMTMTTVLLGAGLIDDYGAYLLPLAWPLGLLITACLPRWAVLSSIACSTVLGLWWIADHSEPERPRSYAAGVRELTGDRPVFLFITSYADVEAIAIHMPQTPFWSFADFAGVPVEYVPAAIERFDAELRAIWAEGREVLLTGDAETALRTIGARNPRSFEHRLLEHLDENYAFEPVEAHGFRGRRIARP